MKQIPDDAITLRENFDRCLIRRREVTFFFFPKDQNRQLVSSVTGGSRSKFLVSEEHSFHFMARYGYCGCGCVKDSAMIRLNILMLTFKNDNFCLKRHNFVLDCNF